MLRGVVKKQFIAGVLVILSLGLVSLGIRLPTTPGLSSASVKPKPRPRAVIRNQTKTCKEIVKNMGPLCASVHGVCLSCPTFCSAEEAVYSGMFHADLASSTPSRASPSLS